MKYSYLNDKNWRQITREERVFCFELYEAARKYPKPFLKVFSKGDSVDFEIGVEVCFYRDVIHEYNMKIGKLDLPKKRTFDLVLFFHNEIIIIEAKANQGFENNQLKSFKKDRESLQKLFKEIKIKTFPKISFGAIYSSKYSPSEKTKSYFEFLCTWGELGILYPNKEGIFNRANHIYGK